MPPDNYGTKIVTVEGVGWRVPRTAADLIAELQQRIATLETAAHAEANEAALTAFAARCEGLEGRVKKLEGQKNNACIQRDSLLLDRKIYRASIKNMAAERDAAVAERDGLREAVNAVASLIDNSSGVIGLHLNGEVAEWHTLLAGGAYEGWLMALSAALPAKSEQEVSNGQ